MDYSGINWGSKKASGSQGNRMKIEESRGMANTLKRSIPFKVESPVPLRQQLHEGLTVWLDGLDIGARIPPERTLAKVIGLSRVTVRNALNPLAQQGILQRSVKGTFLARHPSGSRGGAHPLMRQPGLAAAPARHLTMASYEPWPAQQKAWQTLVGNL